MKIIDKPAVGFGDHEWEEIVRNLVVANPSLLGGLAMQDVTPSPAKVHNRFSESDPFGSSIRSRYLAPPIGYSALS